MGENLVTVQDRVRVVPSKPIYEIGDRIVILGPVRLSLGFLEATQGKGSFLLGCGEGKSKSTVGKSAIYQIKESGPIEIRAAWASGYGEVHRTTSVKIDVGTNTPVLPLVENTISADRTANDFSAECLKLWWQFRFRSTKVHCRPSSYKYEFWNRACDGSHYLPKAIVRPRTHEDVVKAVLFAKENALPVSVRSGGHSYVCRQMRKDSVHIDMRSMKRASRVVSLGGNHSITIGAGTTFRDLRLAYPHHYVICPEVEDIGVGGFFLHGGASPVGWNARLGWGNESVLRMKMVDSNGVTHTLSDTEGHETLWTMMRVAGSSFGIATSLTLRVHPEDERPTVLTFAASSDDDAVRLFEAAALEQTRRNGAIDTKYDAPVAVHGLLTSAVKLVTVTVLKEPFGVMEWIQDQNVSVRPGLTTAIRAIEPILGGYFPMISLWTNVRQRLIAGGANSYGTLIPYVPNQLSKLVKDIREQDIECPMIEFTSAGQRTWLDPWCFTNEEIDETIIKMQSNDTARYVNLIHWGLNASEVWGSNYEHYLQVKSEQDPSSLFPDL